MSARYTPATAPIQKWIWNNVLYSHKVWGCFSHCCQPLSLPSKSSPTWIPSSFQTSSAAQPQHRRRCVVPYSVVLVIQRWCNRAQQSRPPGYGESGSCRFATTSPRLQKPAPVSRLPSLASSPWLNRFSKTECRDAGKRQVAEKALRFSAKLTREALIDAIVAVWRLQRLSTAAE